MNSTRGLAVARDAELLDAARSLSPEISARSAEIEAARTVPADIVRRLQKEGLFRMAMPERLGGTPAAPRTLVEVVEEISHADGATGWSLMIGVMGNAFLGYLEPAVADEIVSHSPDLIVAGATAPLGKGALVDDGQAYQVSGRWQFASGCLHANWLMCGFMVMEGERPKVNAWGMPEMRLAYLPAELARIEDTWRVAGLCGTGSHDVTLDAVVVPVQRTCVPYFSPADQPDPLFRLTAYNLMVTIMVGFALGVGKRALDEATEQLRTKRRLGTEDVWLQDPAVQITLSQRRQGLQAARRHVLETIDEVLADLADGEDSFAGRARLAAAVLHAYDAGRDAALDAFRLVGASALYESNALQRCMRDMVAGAQHVAFSTDSRKRVANALLGYQAHPLFFGV